MSTLRRESNNIKMAQTNVDELLSYLYEIKQAEENGELSAEKREECVERIANFAKELGMDVFDFYEKANEIALAYEADVNFNDEDLSTQVSTKTTKRKYFLAGVLDMLHLIPEQYRANFNAGINLGSTRDATGISFDAGVYMGASMNTGSTTESSTDSNTGASLNTGSSSESSTDLKNTQFSGESGTKADSLNRICDDVLRFFGRNP